MNFSAQTGSFRATLCISSPVELRMLTSPENMPRARMRPSLVHAQEQTREPTLNLVTARWVGDQSPKS